VCRLEYSSVWVSREYGRTLSASGVSKILDDSNKNANTNMKKKLCWV
jgi:hypothetical protein